MFRKTNLLNFLIISYFFLRQELINNLIPSIWFVFLLLIIIISFNEFFLLSSNEKRFLLKKFFWKDLKLKFYFISFLKYKIKEKSILDFVKNNLYKIQRF